MDEREGSAREEAAKMGVREGERAREREYVSGKLRWQAARDGQTWLPAFTGWRRRKLAEDFRRSVGSRFLAPFAIFTDTKSFRRALGDALSPINQLTDTKHTVPSDSTIEKVRKHLTEFLLGVSRC